MKSRYFIIILGLLPLISHIQAEDFYAPWTKSKITNNTKYPVVISSFYSIPGCKLKTLSGMPCTQKGGNNNCDYYGCQPYMNVKFTLKPKKSVTVLPTDQEIQSVNSIEGDIGPADFNRKNQAINETLVIELPFISDPKTKKQVASNVAPIQIDNPSLKNYKISFDGKNLKVD